MNGKNLYVLLLIVSACKCDIDLEKVECKPQQVHIAYGDTLVEMVIMWSTINECSTEIHYGSGPWDVSSNTVQGTSLLLTGQNVVPYLHRVKLTGLKPEMTYYYTPVSNDVSAGPFFFKTPTDSQVWQPEFMVYGDLGIHSDSLAHLQLEALKGIYTAVLHVGDFGYNLPDIVDQGPTVGQNKTVAANVTDQTVTVSPVTTVVSKTAKNVGDVFMRQIEEIASHVPYLVSPGNHEIENDSFQHYRYRFSMPNTDWPIPLNQMWYSLDIGPVHFLSYSSEVFFTSNGQYVKSQRDWIAADLAAANNNRHAQPWIVAFGHRPLYCSNDDGDDCTKQDSLVREGLEDIFYQNGVDVVLQAHEHSYERLWPVYKGVVLATNYSNPPAPVQLITGAAGSKHGIDKMSPLNETWSAFRMDNRSFNSFGRLKVYNSTHMYWEQVAVFGSEVLDSIWITQDSHGPFKQSKLQPEQKEKITEQIKKEEVIKKNRKPKPETTGDTLTEKVAKAFKSVDIKLIVGVSCGVFFILFVTVVCVCRRCRSRPKSYRRWESLDYGKKFYTNLKNEEKEADDFEVEVTDGTTKLIDN